MRAASIAAAGLCCFAFSARAEIVQWFGTDFFFPEGKLAKAADGSLYGTTQSGPTFFDSGAAFKLGTNGTLTALHHFDEATEGSYPKGLTLGADGNFYGVLSHGAATGISEIENGAIYRMTPGGAVSVIHALMPAVLGYPSLEGTDPRGQLVQGPDGNFYGATSGGGATGEGTLFRVTPTGDFSTLHNFNGTDGSLPIGDMVVGADGALYGITQGASSGGGGYGTLFRVTTTGAFSTLHVFTGFDRPTGGLVRGPDGSLYGMTGSNCCGATRGSVYKITSAGQFTTLHAFYSDESESPVGAPIFGADGNLYAATGRDGASDCGTLFMMTPAGVVTTFHHFATAIDGCGPGTGLTQGADGLLYGAVSLGGPADRGGIYKVAPPSGALAPAWIQPPTPVAGELHADVGTALSIPLRAGDPNAADAVHIAGSGLPAIATLASTDGNPASATFSWTPGSAAVGARTVTFTATSGADGLSAPSRAYLVKVKFRPALDAKPALVELDPTGVHLKMKAVLTSQGAPLAGKILTFSSTKTGATLCSATTDAAGVAACGSVQTFWRIAVDGYTVQFAGDAKYWAAFASAGIIGQ